MDRLTIARIAYDAFQYIPKQQQIDTVESYIKGQDTLFIAPTGYGKSFVYQIAPFLLDLKYIPAAAVEESFHSQSTTLCSEPDTVRDFIQPDPSSEADFPSSQLGSAAAASTPVRPLRKHPVAAEQEIANLSSMLGSTTLSETPKNAVIQFVIIMPLVAMITDGLHNLKKLAPQVSAIHFTPASLREARLSSIVFSSPETLLDDVGRKFLQGAEGIKAVFVDEFHIVDSWGLSQSQIKAFRECYGRLGELRAYLKDVPFVCMSATASEGVTSNVVKSLHLISPTIFRVQINKPNICYHRLRVKGSVVADFGWLINLLSSPVNTLPRILIFFRNVNVLSDAFAYVSVKSDSASSIAMFHLNTLPDLKHKVLAELAKAESKLKVIFCTSSLSMGMNLCNIEYVLHYGPPLSAEAFFQETGRAGREPDLVCHSILLTYSHMLSGCKLDEAMLKYAKSEDGCLRNILLSKFDSKKPSDQPHCCQRCEPSIKCRILELIKDAFDTSITESVSDTDSVASLGSVESIPDL